MKAVGLRKLSKRQISEKHIHRAILVLEEQDDPLSAITLAGAAEEILGNMLRDKGMMGALEAKVEWDKEMWAFAKKRADDDRIKGNANRIRNA